MYVAINVSLLQTYYIQKRHKPLVSNDLPLNGMQEVSGSIPLISTKSDRIYYENGKFGHFFYILIF